MNSKDQINIDLKQALLGGDSFKVTVLRSLKAAILNAEVASGKRDTGLPEDEVIGLLQKEAKKRQESADLYANAGEQARADGELAEKKIVDAYLPTQLSEEEIAALVDTAIAETGAQDVKQMGQVIGKVKAVAGATADGGVIARIVKDKLA